MINHDQVSKAHCRVSCKVAVKPEILSTREQWLTVCRQDRDRVTETWPISWIQTRSLSTPQPPHSHTHPDNVPRSDDSTASVCCLTSQYAGLLCVMIKQNHFDATCSWTGCLLLGICWDHLLTICNHAWLVYTQ